MVGGVHPELIGTNGTLFTRRICVFSGKTFPAVRKYKFPDYFFQKKK